MRRAALVLASVAGALVAFLPAGAGARSAEFRYFRTPSGNIYCGYTNVDFAPVSVRCEIRSKLRPMPPRPRSCGDAVWGAGYDLTRRGRARVLCITDTIYSPSARVLAYGTSWRHDGFACASSTAGLRCTNAVRHGFFLSRERSYAF